MIVMIVIRHHHDLIIIDINMPVDEGARPDTFAWP